MGNITSSWEKEKEESYITQHKGHYQQRPREQKYQYWSQQQQQAQHQQLQQQRGQQQHHRQISTMSTSELLDYLEVEIMSTVTIIRNMKKEKNFDDGGRAYILNVMVEMEDKLTKLNNGMNKNKFSKSMPDGGNEQLRNKIHHLKNENSRLKEENIYLDGLLTRSMKEPNTRNKKQSKNEDSRNDNAGNNHKENLKSVQDLQQRLMVCTQELEGEREARVKAVSYVEHLKEEISALQKEKNSLQLRLSKLAGERLTENNPGIADLSDPNRPTKIGEMYSEMYDNEWTDAFESLVDAGYQEIEAVDTLRLTLLNVLQFCSKKSDSLLKKTEEAVNILFEEYKETEQKSNMRHLTMPKKLAEQWGRAVQRSSFDPDAIFLQQKWKPLDQTDPHDKQKSRSLEKPNTSGEVIGRQLKIFRKEVAVSMVPLVEKAYMSASWNEECIYNLKPFIRKCILIGWMMVVQSPPMALADLKPNEELKKEIYKEYTKSGSHIDYIVWPALLLQKGGPVVGKGVAQGKTIK